VTGAANRAVYAQHCQTIWQLKKSELTGQAAPAVFAVKLAVTGGEAYP
jgi:hypothetical protein